MEIKNIAIVINSLKSGGAEKQSILLTNALAKDENYNVFFIIIDNRHTENKLYNLLDKNKCNIIDFNGFKPKNIFAATKILKQNKVTHLFAFLTMSTIFSVIVGKLAKVQYIYGSVRNSRLPRIKKIIELLIANNFTNQTIHNSYSGEKYFKAKGMKNTIVIPNCYVNILPKFIRENQETVKIISIGRFVEQKDYGTALKAIKSLSQSYQKFEYHIIGWGHLEKNIKEKIANYNLQNYVHVHINPKNMREVLHNSDIFLLTSLFEGTSNAIMEAMDESLPVVATDAGDNNYLVRNGENGYICQIGDFDGISKKLFNLCNDKNLRIEMGLKSNKLLQDNYSEDAFKAKYVKLLHASGTNK